VRVRVLGSIAGARRGEQVSVLVPKAKDESEYPRSTCARSIGTLQAWPTTLSPQ
jgi:hypothetical protein